MELTVKRDFKDELTHGKLYLNGEYICETLERPWKNNERRVSCIPGGEYPITLKKYGRFHEKDKDKSWYKGVLLLEDTDPRSEILIHTANYWKELHGCIAPGIRRHKTGVWSSGKAYKLFYDRVVKAIESGEQVTIKLNEYNQKN